MERYGWPRTFDCDELADHLSETSNVAWKTDIPGRGWSTPVVQGHDIWLTTAIEFPADEKETAERLKTNTGDQPLIVLSRVELRALCIDRQSGQIKKNVLLIDKQSPQWVHNSTAMHRLHQC